MSAESRIHPFYACPTTGDPLHRNGDVLENSDGSRRYPIVRGVPVFLRHEPLESVSDAEKLERLGSLARSSDWRSAIQEVYGEHPYTTATSRMNCLDLLPLTETSTVLEIGASLGQFTPEIRRRAGRVYGLEVVQGQAEFAAERCRQEELDEVYLACGGDDCRLPYEDGSFDIVILSLVLEWCASRHGDEPAETVQRRMLSECCRVLRAGGNAGD